MPRNFRVPTALCAVFICGALLAACGSGIPGNAVARVGDASITRATFDHWMQVAAASSAQSTPGQKASQAQVPDAPNFTNCIALKERTAPKPAKGQPTPTAADFKAQCQQQYQGLLMQVMSFLISSQWILGESSEQGLTASSTEINTRLQTIKQQQFPKPADFQKFLTNSGMTYSDLLYRVKLIVLSDKLRNKVVSGKDKVSSAQVASYYQTHQSAYGQPERRDLRIVLTKTLAKAQAAKRAIQSGQSFAKVAKRFSIDPSKNQGGALLGVTRGQEEKSLDTAVFAAKQGVLTGPVKTQFGFYIFRVQKVTPASQQTLTQATPEIKALLAQQDQQQALNTFIANYQKKWRSRTNCRSGYVVQSCSNYHAPAGSSGVTGPAVPSTGATGSGGSSGTPPRVGG